MNHGDNVELFSALIGESWQIPDYSECYVFKNNKSLKAWNIKVRVKECNL